MSYYAPLVYTVPAEEDGWSLKSILQHRMQISRTLLARLKQTEQGILVNGERQYVSFKVTAGDRVEARMEEEQSEDILPQQLPFDILHEDEHLLVVNKEAGMIVHPTHGHYTGTLANGVVYYWQQLGVKHRFRPVHRLDQDTTGVLVIAKNPYAHHFISEQLKQHQVEKQYVALVHGRVEPESGSINAPIDRDPEAPHIRIVTEDGDTAITHYEVERRFPQATLVRLSLETGRTHQIRVHMQHIGHPLVGDAMYGSGESGTLDESVQSLMGRQALHAVKLGFKHPVDQRWVEYAAPLPADMAMCIKQLSDVPLRY